MVGGRAARRGGRIVAAMKLKTLLVLEITVGPRESMQYDLSSISQQRLSNVDLFRRSEYTCILKRSAELLVNMCLSRKNGNNENIKAEYG